ncbi:MAG: cellulase family glycosylhydrolase [Bacteroidaceae bacterium]|nr:cellulase family glycosylhydrolase [Bacteroidaceae bacterium]
MKNLNWIVMLFTFLCLSCSGGTEDEPIVPEEPETPTVPEEEEKKEEVQPEDNTPLVLNVVGRYLKDNTGNVVNLHGFGQTFSPFFNNNAWNNYDVAGCLRYNKGLIDQILAAGWRMNFVRMHMDPYWSDDPNQQSVRYEGHERFSETRFKKYLDEVFVPMAEYAVSKGLFVVMRPPGVSPEKIAVNDDYQAFLIKVWDIVSQHSKLKNNGHIMFELANEPINILGPDGTYASTGDGHFKNLKAFFQAVVDKVRGNKARNIIWVPGLAYQSNYEGYATYPIEGENIGYAIHVYPGWYGSDAEQPSAELGGVMGGGYEGFQRGWDAQIMPVARFAPIMVTEMDWAPAKYDSSWGKSITGVVGGTGFGANFKYIADNSGNVSWMIFTSPHLLAQFKNEPGTEGNYTFFNDPEACPWPVYHWFKEYAGEGTAEGELTSLEIMDVDKEIDIRMGDSKSLIVKALYKDGSSELVTSKIVVTSSDESIVKVDGFKLIARKMGEVNVTVAYTSAAGVKKDCKLTVKVITPFPLTNAMFNPSIWEPGSFDETTATLITGEYGFGGWQYAEGLDLSEYNTLTVELGNDNNSMVSFRLFDKNNYWSKPATYDFGSSRKVVVQLNAMKDDVGAKIESSHLYIVGFWSLGFKPIIIKSLSLK